MLDKKNLLIGGGIFIVAVYLLNPYSGSFRGEAQTSEFSYQSSEIGIVNFVGTVTHTKSPDHQIHFKTINPRPEFTPRFNHIGGRLQVSNFDKITDIDCSNFSWFWNQNSSDDEMKISINGASKNLMSDYPIVEIQTPDHIDLQIENSLINGKFGDFDSLSMDMNGCGNVRFGDISNDARVSLKGSADVEIHSIGGKANIQLRGSGNVKIGNVASDSSSIIRGSGNINYGEIHGIHRMVVRGSGDIKVKNMIGDAELAVQGSGDIDIKDGDVKWFIAKVQGSGDIEYGGKFANQKTTVQGSGEITLDQK